MKLLVLCVVLAAVAASAAEPRSLLGLEAQFKANADQSNHLVSDMVMRISEAQKDASRQVAEISAQGGNCDELKPYLKKFEVDLKTLKKEKNAMAVLKDLAEASRALKGYYRTKMRLADQLALYTAKRFWADNRAKKREGVIRDSIRRVMERKMLTLNKKRRQALALKKAVKKANKAKTKALKKANKAKSQVKSLLKAQAKAAKRAAKKAAKKASKAAKKAKKAVKKAKKLASKGSKRAAKKAAKKARKLGRKAKKLAKKAAKKAKKAGLKSKKARKVQVQEDDVAVVPEEKPVVFSNSAMSVRADMFGFDINKAVHTADVGKLSDKPGKLVKPKARKAQIVAQRPAAKPTANPFVTADVGTGDYSRARTDVVQTAGVAFGGKLAGTGTLKRGRVVVPANKVKAWNIEAINARPDTTEYTQRFLKELKPVVNVPAGKLSVNAKRVRTVIPGLF